jgi:hypothetical protein
MSSLCGEQENFEGGSDERSLRQRWVILTHDVRSLLLLSLSSGGPHDLCSVRFVTSHDEKLQGDWLVFFLDGGLWLSACPH